MRRHSIPIMALAALFLLALSPSGHQVRYVCDGDTVILKTGQRVRYVGIDAPEMGGEGEKAEFMAGEARAFNARAVLEGRLRLEFDRERRDRYDRLLAYLYLPDGRLLNAVLVREGLARVVTRRPNLLHREDLLRAQRDAMTDRLGIWSRQIEPGGGPYVGSRRSFRFHRAGCPYARRIRGKNRIHFDTRRSAFWEGYSPCSHCLP